MPFMGQSGNQKLKNKSPSLAPSDGKQFAGTRAKQV